MRQATQQARLVTLAPLVGYVGAAVDIWRSHGLVSEEERTAFRDALAAAGMELALAPLVIPLDEEGLAAKGAAAARQGPRPRHPRRHDTGGAHGDAPKPQAKGR